MKFASFEILAGQSAQHPSRKAWGVLGANHKLLDLSSGPKALAPDLLTFLRGDWKSELKNIAAKLAKADIPLTAVKLEACIPNPPSMRDGYAFRQHVEAARRNRGVPMIAEFDQFPTFYFTNHYGVIGPGPCVVQSKHLAGLDFELESAIVIGREGMNVKASDADDYIFGYTIMNDFSARDWQMEEMKMSLGPAKGKDFATALGPWLVTRDELADKRQASNDGERFDLTMTAEHNGKEVSRGNMKDMNWTFAQIIERVSYGVKIYPGDVIGSGTVGTGCYMELNGTHGTKTWLKPGERILLKIDGLGELDNTIELRDNF